MRANCAPPILICFYTDMNRNLWLSTIKKPVLNLLVHSAITVDI